MFGIKEFEFPINLLNALKGLAVFEPIPRESNSPRFPNVSISEAFNLGIEFLSDWFPIITLMSEFV